MIITHEPDLITNLESDLWILEDHKITFYNNSFDLYINGSGGFVGSYFVKTLSPNFMLPELTVPVTTVPKPLLLKWVFNIKDNGRYFKRIFEQWKKRNSI